MVGQKELLTVIGNLKRQAASSSLHTQAPTLYVLCLSIYSGSLVCLKAQVKFQGYHLESSISAEGSCGQPCSA